MKTLLLILIFATFALPVSGPGDNEPTSRVTILQTGTIPASQLKQAVVVYEQWGCSKIGYFHVAEGRVNVYCLGMMVAERPSFRLQP